MDVALARHWFVKGLDSQIKSLCERLSSPYWLVIRIGGSAYKNNQQLIPAFGERHDNNK
jgi:hypothetical protein